MWGEVVAAVLAATAALLSSWIAAGGSARRRQAALRADLEMLNLLPLAAANRDELLVHIERSLSDHLRGAARYSGAEGPRPIWIQLSGSAVMVGTGIGVVVGFGKSSELHDFAMMGSVLIGIGAMLAGRALMESADGLDP